MRRVCVPSVVSVGSTISVGSVFTAGLAGVLAFVAPAAAQTYDFSGVDAIAQRALAGDGIDSPVPGFDLLLLKDGVTVYHRAFGAWSLDRVAAADSTTKTISGAVILSLVDSSPRPFSLDTRLSTYIPQFTGAKQTITVRQAFSHTSGLRDNLLAVGALTPSLAEAALNIADDTLEFLPGTEFEYGGTSMHAAGAAAEVESGLAWNTLFQQRLAGPLGWTHTRYVLSNANNPRIAGGCESNASEFARFMEMIRRGGMHGSTRVLSQSAVAAMLTRQTPVGIPITGTPLDSPFTDGADYGVGIWLAGREDGGGLSFAIAAGARGFSGWVDLRDGIVGVFATDLSASSNVQPLLYELIEASRGALADEVCAADLDDDGDFGNGGARDEAVTIDDLLYFLVGFEAGSVAVDLDDDGDPAAGTPDGAVTIDDVLFFLVRFEAGC